MSSLILHNSALSNHFVISEFNLNHRSLHSFPTRRSSDLTLAGLLGGGRSGCQGQDAARVRGEDRKSTRLNSSHLVISYAVFCLKKNSWFIIINSLIATINIFTSRMVIRSKNTKAS